MRDLFDRRPEIRGQHLEVVAAALGALQKPGVGHQRGPGKVVRQPHLRDVTGRGAVETREIQGCLKQVVLAHKGDLQQHLERLCGLRGAGRDMQYAAGRIIAAQGICLVEGDGDAGAGQRL